MDLQKPHPISDLVRQSRRLIEAGTFEAFMRFMRMHVPTPPRQHVAVFTRMAVQQFQKWQLDENSKLRLSDAQILAVMRVEFPLNPRKAFTGTLEEGLKVVAGIRAHYNRDGHNGPSPRERGWPVRGELQIPEHFLRCCDPVRIVRA